ncbi:prostatic acid phosphatase-like isoform X2 [Stegodyphus dumicola]|uniref:prostatic acid phosphatase-like isoform X2 n=1 Tax=Stegodyphus dumicola TaxID=202533 RepID=UPI0015AC0D56|nr:prostatic acid phosphatase-like isoform X2 [Stegodyphus dumicola]
MIGYMICMLLTQFSTGTAELRLIQVVFRKSQWFPEVSRPDNQYGFLWENRAEKIAQTGMFQHYRMGQSLRKRYSNFLSSQSKNGLREAKECTSSSECFLIGLNDLPFFDYSFSSNRPYADDQMDIVCPQLLMETSRMYDSDEGYKIISENKRMYEYWSDNSGMKIRNPADAIALFQSLSLQKSLNLSTPTWATSSWDDLKKQADIHFYWISKQKSMQRLTAGPLLGLMIKRMQDRINGDSRKVYVYSGRNSNIAGLLSSFGTYKGVEPPFGSTVVVELHEYNGGSYVRVLYFYSSTPNLETDEPEVIVIRGCSEYCPFEKFRSLTKSLVPENWEEECGFSSAITLCNMVFLVILCILLSFIENA